MTNIYEKAQAALPKDDISHWCSDLYLRATEASKALIESYDFRQNVKTFIDQIDHVKWYEIPFAYTPYYNGGDLG